MQYTDFTVSVINGSHTVTGAFGTKFTSKVHIGDAFKVKGDIVIYQVSSIINDTEFTLSAPFMGATNASALYQVTVDFTPEYGFSEVCVGDQDWPIHLTQGMIRKVDSALSTKSPIEGPGVNHDFSVRNLFADGAVFSALPVFESNTAAAALVTGTLYRTSTGVLMVKY